VKNKSLLWLSYGLERWIYRHAALISGQTQGIVNTIQARFPQKRVIWFPNGVDIAFWQKEHEVYPWREELGIEHSEFVVLYAGIIGHAQGLEIIIKTAQLLRFLPVKFVIVGDGPEKEDLMNQATQSGLTNIIFKPNQSKQRIPSLIALCDAYLVPLRKLDLFKGAIPSKLFEPLAMGKPILLGVDGEARSLFINQGKGGLYFEPENPEELANNIMLLMSDQTLAKQLGASGYDFVISRFDRNQIHESFLRHIGVLTGY
jgi:glycosyltransferase involved in cell wall biosynthesis